MSANPDHFWPDVAPSIDRGFPADDHVLLLRFVQSTSHAAFAELVARHHRLVHSTCRQALHDSHLADDATQTVFMTLARKAASLPADVRLRGWLYQTARHIASDLRKQEMRRRRRHEQIVQTALDRGDGFEPPDENLRITIAEILGQLSTKDRVAVSMRYFEGMTFAEMAGALGLSREGAKKRVIRALARIRAQLVAKMWCLAIFMPVAGLLRKASLAKAWVASVAGPQAPIYKTVAKSLRALMTSAGAMSRLTAVRLATSTAMVAVAVFSAQQQPSSNSSSAWIDSSFFQYSAVRFRPRNANQASNDFSPVEKPYQYASYPPSLQGRAGSVKPIAEIMAASPAPTTPGTASSANAATVASARTVRLDAPAIADAKKSSRYQGVPFFASNDSVRSGEAIASIASAASSPPENNSTLPQWPNHPWMDDSPMGGAFAFFPPGMMGMFGFSQPRFDRDMALGDDGTHDRTHFDLDSSGYGSQPQSSFVPGGLRAFAFAGFPHFGLPDLNFGAANYSGTNASTPATPNSHEAAYGFANVDPTQATEGSGDIAVATNPSAYTNPTVASASISMTPDFSAAAYKSATASGTSSPVSVPALAYLQPAYVRAAFDPPPTPPTTDLTTQADADPTLSLPAAAQPMQPTLAADFSPMFSAQVPEVTQDSFAAVDFSAVNSPPQFSVVQAVPEPAAVTSMLIITGAVLLRRSTKKAI